MFVDLHSFAPTLLVLGFCFLAMSFFPVKKTWGRTVLTVVCIFLGLRYLKWRLLSTVLVYDEPFGLEIVWIWIVFFVEIAVYLEVVIFYLIMSRYQSRHDEANEAEEELYASNNFPPVDIFIPTFNEPSDVLEKTIVGAVNINYPNFIVWVLDDGNREWLREMCVIEGARYLSRADNSHAKAGNLNNALQYAEGDYIAIFDADFVPHRNFLSRTIGLFSDPKIGVVQTPQHFFNYDPIQFNLGLQGNWPDEQRLFFDKMAECRDAWGVAFCCGSCSVTSRSALKAIGDQFPIESITEDLLTTLKMSRAGYKTRYLNERLSMGLAPESLQAFFVQRARWCRGGIQSIFLPDGPLGSGIPILHRILFFPWGWLIQYPSRFVLMLIPVVALCFGLLPLKFTSVEDIVSYQLPVLVVNYMFLRWIMPHHYFPLLSTAQGWFATFRLLPTVLSSIIKPFGTPFKVTPKGSLNKFEDFDVLTFACILFTIIATSLGILANCFPETQMLHNDQFSPLAMLWSSYNVVILLLALLMCFEAPRKRLEERFDSDEFCVLHGEKDKFVRIYDISLNGCRIDYSGHSNISHITIDGVGRLEVKTMRHFPWKTPRFTSLLFVHDHKTHRLMIRKLYGGKYANGVKIVVAKNIVFNLMRRMLGKPLS